MYRIGNSLCRMTAMAARSPLRAVAREPVYSLAIRLIPSMTPRSATLARTVHTSARSILSKPPCSLSWTNKTIALAYCIFVTGSVAFVGNHLSQRENFLNKLESFQKTKNWTKVVHFADKELNSGIYMPIHEQVIAHDGLFNAHFRLGNFEKAKIHAEKMLSLAKEDKKDAIVDALYKCSAAVRGMARILPPGEEQQKLFLESENLAILSLQAYKEYGFDDTSLKARVLANLGCVYCDNPEADHKKGMILLLQAYALLNPLPAQIFTVDTLLDLGKKYFLQGNLEKSRSVFEIARMHKLEKPTQMRFFYLEAQILIQEGHLSAALGSVCQGMEVARTLKNKEFSSAFNHLAAVLDEAGAVKP